jgi:ABC-2 type transport system ATP-binding protein
MDTALTEPSSAGRILALADDAVVQARGLTMRYGEVEVLRDVDLDVWRGEILALLGPNGAGKTTLVEIFAGFREPTAGEATVLGANPATAGRRWRERVGIVLQDSRPEPGLSVRECLELYGGYYRRPRPVDDTLALVGLTDRGDVLGEHLSGGQLRRLDVALALIGDPELLFLDEPTTGFDPGARYDAWSAIDRLRALGTTIVLTTHHMDEAERLADRIAFIAQGEIVAAGPPGRLGGRCAAAARISFTLPRGLETAELSPSLPVRIDSQGAVEVRSDHPPADLHAPAGWALDNGVDLPDLAVHRLSLEDVYLRLTGDEEDRCS